MSAIVTSTSVRPPQKEAKSDTPTLPKSLPPIPKSKTAEEFAPKAIEKVQKHLQEETQKAQKAVQQATQAMENAKDTRGSVDTVIGFTLGDKAPAVRQRHATENLSTEQSQLKHLQELSQNVAGVGTYTQNGSPMTPELRKAFSQILSDAREASYTPPSKETQRKQQQELSNALGETIGAGERMTSGLNAVQGTAAAVVTGAVATFAIPVAGGAGAVATIYGGTGFKTGMDALSGKNVTLDTVAKNLSDSVAPVLGAGAGVGVGLVTKALPGVVQGVISGATNAFTTDVTEQAITTGRVDPIRASIAAGEGAIGGGTGAYASSVTKPVQRLAADAVDIGAQGAASYAIRGEFDPTSAMLGSVAGRATQVKGATTNPRVSTNKLGVQRAPSDSGDQSYVRYLNKQFDRLAEGVGLPENARRAMSRMPEENRVVRALPVECLEPAMNAANAQAKITGAQPVYAEIDIGNLGALNGHTLKLANGDPVRGRQMSDEVLGDISRAIRTSLDETVGKGKYSYIKKGGDEFGIVIDDSRGVDMKRVEERMASGVAGVVKEHGLENLPHTKYPGVKGMGVYMAHGSTLNSSSEAVLHNVGEAVEVRKKEYVASVTGSPPVAERKELPPEVRPPSQEAIAHSRMKQDGVATVYKSGDGVDLNDPTKPFMDHRSYLAELNKKYAQIYGLSDEHTRVISRTNALQNPSTDPTIKGAVSPPYRDETLHRVHDYLARRESAGLPSEASFARCEMVNMAGLNKKLGAKESNQQFKRMEKFIGDELRSLGQDVQVVPMRRDGSHGVVVEYAVIGASQKQVQGALTRANGKIEEYTKSNGFSEIPHPKWADDPRQVGVKMAMGVTDIKPRETIVETDHRIAKTMHGIESDRLRPSIEAYNAALDQNK